MVVILSVTYESMCLGVCVCMLCSEMFTFWLRNSFLTHLNNFIDFVKALLFGCGSPTFAIKWK